MITNTQVARYLREHSRGRWEEYFTLQELISLHGLTGKFRVLVEDNLPIALARREIISNLAGHKTAWLDGLEGLAQALVFLSPAVPTCTEVHVNLVPESSDRLELLKTRLDSDEYKDWDSELIIHTATRSDPQALTGAIPDELDVAIVVAFEASQAYLEVLIDKLAVGGVIWLEASTLGGRPLIHPDSELARLNRWIAQHPKLEVAMGTDFIGYTLIRKVSK